MATNGLQFRVVRLLATGALASAAAPPLLAHSEQGRAVTGYRSPPPTFEQGYGGELIIEGTSQLDVAVGPGVNGFGSELYVVVREDNLLLTIDTERRVTELAELDIVFPQGSASSPTFDVLGLYSGALLLNEVRLHEQAEVAPDGDARASDIIEGLETELTLAFDPTGVFGGYLFVADLTGDLYAVAPEGTVDLFATGVGHGGMCFVADGNGGEALYIADGARRRIVRLAPDHVRGEPAPVWIDFTASGDNVRPVSLAVSRGGGFGTDVVYVADAAHGSVTRLGPDGAPDGDLVQGLVPGPTTIELPESGMFAGSMVIANAGRIWVVHPEIGQPQGDGAGCPGIADLLLVLGALGSDAGGPGDVDQDGRVGLADVVAVLETGAFAD